MEAIWWFVPPISYSSKVMLYLTKDEMYIKRRIDPLGKHLMTSWRILKLNILKPFFLEIAIIVRAWWAQCLSTVQFLDMSDPYAFQEHPSIVYYNQRESHFATLLSCGLHLVSWSRLQEVRLCIAITFPHFSYNSIALHQLKLMRQLK